ncbi:MAG TPA: GNAT family N-acetyltransferase [Gammaproteobacteria bacterium]|nr:GNAT family N-acetyltransferase [Gammaproteobacteria bacterium]
MSVSVRLATLADIEPLAALLRTAAEVARASGAARLKLSTEIENVPAQRLYTALGWKRDEDFYEYGLSL